MGLVLCLHHWFSTSFLHCFPIVLGFFTMLKNLLLDSVIYKVEDQMHCSTPSSQPAAFSLPDGEGTQSYSWFLHISLLLPKGTSRDKPVTQLNSLWFRAANPDSALALQGATRGRLHLGFWSPLGIPQVCSLTQYLQSPWHINYSAFCVHFGCNTNVFKVFFKFLATAYPWIASLLA